MANYFSSTLLQLIRLKKQKPSPGTEVPYPKLRNFILDIMAEGRRKNIINLLLEADVTLLRSNLVSHRAETGEQLSLTANIAKKLACTIDEDRSMHAYRHGKSKLVLFDEIDLSFMIERTIEECIMPIIMIVRGANHKSMSKIHQELQTAQSAPLGEKGLMSAPEKYFFKLPNLLRKTVWFFIRRDPYLFKQLAGTVGVTSIGMHSSSPMVTIPITPMTLTLSIGSIGKKLILENGLPVEHEFIQMNLGADHDIIDGAPLVRFADRFRKKLEEG
jgi:pyruvate/2-oxoglutarate dehydrogenase complex dihydrolipoamide acyltransferase (E2) component